MTEPRTQPLENVGRGIAFALLSIPAGMIMFGVISGIFSLVESYLVFVAGIAAYVIPSIAVWLYERAAGAPLRNGRFPFATVSVIAIALGVFTGIIASAYFVFTRVGGDGGLFNPVFWTTVRNQIALDFATAGIPVVIGLGFGFFGLFQVMNGTRLGKKAGVEAPAAPPAPGVVLNGEPLDPDKK